MLTKGATHRIGARIPPQLRVVSHFLNGFSQCAFGSATRTRPLEGNLERQVHIARRFAISTDSGTSAPAGFAAKHLAKSRIYALWWFLGKRQDVRCDLINIIQNCVRDRYVAFTAFHPNVPGCEKDALLE